MRTFPDFTWEYIIERCEKNCAQYLDWIAQDTRGGAHPRLKMFLQNAQGLLDIVPQLRAHPQLGQFVPMMSMLSLIWFPDDEHHIVLVCEEKDKYLIDIWKDNEMLEQKVVGFDAVANEIVAFIQKLTAP
jgi:hypothetical protein